MSHELGEVLQEAGHTVNPADPLGHRPATFLWFNFLAEDAGLWQKLVAMRKWIGFLQYFVDHPLALAVEQVNRIAARPNYLLALPCLDGAHLLRQRWPNMTHG